MARLYRILLCNTISFASKLSWRGFLSPPFSSVAVKHGRCLLTLKKRIQAVETKCLRKLLRISYWEHKTNKWLQSKINFLVGPQEHLLATFRRRNFAWFGHVTRHDDSLSKTILQGTLEGGRRRGRQRKCWMDNIREWTSLPMPELLTRTSLQKRLEEVNRPSCPPWQPIRSRDWTEQMVNRQKKEPHITLCRLFTGPACGTLGWLPALGTRRQLVLHGCLPNACTGCDQFFRQLFLLLRPGLQVPRLPSVFMLSSEKPDSDLLYVHQRIRECSPFGHCELERQERVGVSLAMYVSPVVFLNHSIVSTQCCFNPLIFLRFIHVFSQLLLMVLCPPLILL